MVHVDQLITVVNMLLLDDIKEWMLDHFWQCTSCCGMILTDSLWSILKLKVDEKRTFEKKSDIYSRTVD